MTPNELALIDSAQEWVDHGLAEWVDEWLPVERCHLCRYPLGESYVQTENGLRWCHDLVECKDRAAKLLGVREPGDGTTEAA